MEAPSAAGARARSGEASATRRRRAEAALDLRELVLGIGGHLLAVSAMNSVVAADRELGSPGLVHSSTHKMAAAAPNSNDILDSARFSTRGGSSRYDDAPTASSILGSSSIDPASLHPLAGLVDSKDLDYLLLDDDKISAVDGGKSVLPSRGWGDELCYGTGSTYLAGTARPLLARPRTNRLRLLFTNNRPRSWWRLGSP